MVRKREFERKASNTELLLKEKELWKTFECQDSPDVFGFIGLAKDGGLSEVDQLYTWSRWISSVVLIAFVFYNVYSIVVLDTSLILRPEAAVLAMSADADPNKLLYDFYLSGRVYNATANMLYGHDAETKSAVPLLGSLELVGLGVAVLGILKYCFDMCKRGTTGFTRWFAVQAVFFELIPYLSTYSALKLLNYCVPSLAAQQLYEFVCAIQEAKAERRNVFLEVGRLVLWLVVVVFAFILGFDTFLLKLRVVAALANDPEGSSRVLLALIQFLVQILGIVQLGPFTRKRLFQFVFGGEDGILQDEEIELMDTWNALLARKIYRSYPFSKFIAVMTSFSDYDFQRLVINEDEETKEYLRDSSSGTLWRSAS